MRAAVVSGPRSARVVEVPDPHPGPGDVLVRIAYVGLCGTDLEIFHGISPYLQDGRACFPHRFGHEWVGTVTSVAEDVSSVRPGDAVTGSTMLFCNECADCSSGARNLCSRLSEIGLYDHHGAAAEQLVLPARVVTSFGPVQPEPSHVLVEPLVTVLEALSEVDITPLTEVLVVGAGTVGSLAVAVLAHAGASIDVIEPGTIDHLVPGSVREHLRSAPQREYSLVIEASGGPGAFTTAVAALRTGGTCLLVGVSPHRESIEPGRVALDGLRILGVRHGVDHYQRAVTLHPVLADAMDQLVDSVVPLDQITRAFELLEHERDRPKVVLSVV